MNLWPSGEVSATPIFALMESQNCAGCHKPGRRQRAIPLRRCTLDCAGCHIDPAGAGPRNQWGYYYANDQLPTIKFFKPIDPLQDESRFDVHLNSRIIQRKTDDESRTFPMSSEFTLRVRPFIEYLHFTYSGLYLGRIDDDSFRTDMENQRRYLDKYSVMIDQIPFGMYVRSYRGQPIYGIRRPNHTLWIRERVGLDQFALTDAVEVGGTPNVPFLRYSIMEGNPHHEPEDRQKGTSFHGGVRGVTAAWHLNGSMWDTQSEKAKIQMKAFGAGASIFKFMIYGERNWRTIELLEPPATESASFKSQAVRIHPSSTISEYSVAFGGIPGVHFGYYFETLVDPFQDSERRSYFLDLHPIPWVAMEFWVRSETGTRTLDDQLAIGHLYFDF